MKLLKRDFFFSAVFFFFFFPTLVRTPFNESDPHSTSTWDRSVRPSVVSPPTGVRRVPGVSFCFPVGLNFIRHIYCLETICFSVRDLTSFVFFFWCEFFFFFLLFKRISLQKSVDVKRHCRGGGNQPSVRFLVPHCGCLKIWCFLIFGFFFSRGGGRGASERTNAGNI